MDIQRTADHWDRQHFSTAFLRAEWSYHPLALERLHRLLGADSRAEWFARTFVPHPPARRALGVGVGTATTELDLLAGGAVAHYDLYDVSPVALDAARAEAERRGIAARARFICADINAATLPPHTYDIVTFIASLHHIAALDATLQACHDALLPGGVLWAAEYVGPDRFAFPDADTAFAKRLYRALDPDLKKAWEPELRFPSVEEVVAVDPTESVHSAQIIAATRRAFPKVEVIPTYGTLAFILSWCLNHDALYDTDKGWEAFRTILDIDTAMLDTGALPHYFAYLIARKAGGATPKRRLIPLRRRRR